MGRPAAASRLQKCADAAIIVEGTAHRLQYSNKHENFIFHFLFHRNYIPYASSTLQIEVLLTIKLWHFTF